MAKKSNNNNSSGSKVSSRSIVFWIIGLCSFVSFMISGILWILQKVGITFAALGQIKSISSLILMIAAFVAGWVWLLSCRMNKKVKLVLEITFVIFAVLALLGNFSI